MNRINANKGDQGQWRYPANPFIDPVNNSGAAVPMSAATDGRDHWLAPGEPHCADCHAAPYTEQSGNINPFPPFNYPAKASLMRYSRGHQDITCQGCHESIHGLYPVTPTIDTTSYAQAAALNHDGSHGPLKCGTCHLVNGEGVPSFIEDGITYNGQPIKENFDLAVSWAHTFTDNADPREDFCVNCHGDNRNLIDSSDKTWTEHAFKGRSSRQLMDKAELAQLGHVGGDPAFEDPLQTVCTAVTVIAAGAWHAGAAPPSGSSICPRDVHPRRSGSMCPKTWPVRHAVGSGAVTCLPGKSGQTYTD